MLKLSLSAVDYVILIIYFAIVVAIGALARRAVATSEDFLLSGRSLPAWITGLAFIAANLGAIEILGHGGERCPVRADDRALLLDRRSAGDGVPGPGDDAVLLRLRVRSVPEYLRLRFNKPTHVFNALTFALVQRPHRRRQPLRAGPGAGGAAGLESLPLDRRGRRLRGALHHAGWALRRHLQRGPAVLRDSCRPDPARRGRAVPGRRLARADPEDRAPRAWRHRRAVPMGPQGIHAVGGNRVIEHEPAGRQLVCDRVRPRLRPLVRLLDDELRRSAAVPGCEEPFRRAAHPAHRRLPEDLHSGADHHPGSHRGRHLPDAGRPTPTRSLTYNDAIPAADGPVPAQRCARRRRDRPAGRFHGRYGREREQFQHGGHLRPLAAVHPARPVRRLLPQRRPGGDGGGNCRGHLHRVHRVRLPRTS